MRLDDNLIKGRKKVHSLSTLRAEVLFRIMHVKEELREREREREMRYWEEKSWDKKASCVATRALMRV